MEVNTCQLNVPLEFVQVILKCRTLSDTKTTEDLQYCKGYQLL